LSISVRFAKTATSNVVGIGLCEERCDHAYHTGAVGLLVPPSVVSVVPLYAIAPSLRFQIARITGVTFPVTMYGSVGKLVEK
jgi:hypothetical protein